MGIVFAIMIRNYSLFIAVICVVFTVGVVVGFVFAPHSGVRGKGERQTGYRLINPLLECEVVGDGVYTELRPFREELTTLVQKMLQNREATHISVYFRDLNNGPWIGINEKELFAPSSLLKVPLLFSVFEQSDRDPSFMQKKMVYSGEFDLTSSQNVKPSHILQRGSSYTISNLLERTIIESDNTAAKLLTLAVDSDLFFRPYESLGLQKPNSTEGEYYLRVKDYASFFRVLYNASYLSRAQSERALELLSRSAYTRGLVQGVPRGVTVAHKFGERKLSDVSELQLHDCGIVYHRKKPYLLCVMTKGAVFTRLEQVISEISKMVYENVEHQVR